MPHLLREPWTHVVPLIPFADHSTNVEPAFWQEPFANASLADQHEAIFANRSAVRLTRWRLLNFPYPNASQKCLEVLLWGYPKGIQGQQHLAFLGNLNDIATAAANDVPWPDYYDQLNQLGNLGMSTISKLAYFHQRHFQGVRALILDQRLISVIGGGRWEPLHLPGLDYRNAPGHYVDYLRQMHMVAAMVHAVPDQLELCLFSWGDAF